MEQPRKERNTDFFQGLKLATNEDDYSERTHPVFLTFWYAVNSMLILSILLAVYAAGWEYSTRRYLKGFSDAIIPESASPQERKSMRFLNWMSHGPSRQQSVPDSSSSDRDPTSTLNYASLLPELCGSATNAFVNLADSEGLRARRLLLLDSNRRTRHVVAEVLMDGRWIVVDPAFRTQLRGDDGQSLTREQLTEPGVLSSATATIPKYSSDYTYDMTAHVRLARIRFGGTTSGNDAHGTISRLGEFGGNKLAARARVLGHISKRVDARLDAGLSACRNAVVRGITSWIPVYTYPEANCAARARHFLSYRPEPERARNFGAFLLPPLRDAALIY